MSGPRILAALGTTAAMLAACLAVWSPVSASAAGAGTPVTLTFTTSGEHAFTLPANVFALHVVAVGGKGADAQNGPYGTTGGTGAYGAVVTADVDATPGATLYADVGGNASGANGAGGAAPGGAGGGSNAGGGGAASMVTPCSTTGAGCVNPCLPFFAGNCTPPLQALVVAAGGAGGGSPAQPTGTSGGGCGCASDGASGGNGGQEGAAGANGAVSADNQSYGLLPALGGQPGAQTYTTNGGRGGGRASCNGNGGATGQNGSEIGGAGGAGGGGSTGGGSGGGGGGGRFGGGGGGGGGYQANCDIATWGGGAGGGGGSSYVAGATTSQLAADTGLDSSGVPSVTVSYTIPGPPAQVHVTTSPTEIPADGTSTTTASATVTDVDGNLIPSQTVSITSSDPAEQVSAVTANPDGTYTATITASTKIEKATITATSDGLQGSTVLGQTGPPAHVSVSLAPARIVANGTSQSMTSVFVTDAAGNALPGQSVSVTSSDAGEQIGSVTDEGGGYYGATITSSTTVGDATITATDATKVGTATLSQTAPTTVSRAQLVISALRLKGPSGNGTGDSFIQLLNTTGGPLLLTGWKVTWGSCYGCAAAMTGITLPANGHVLITGPAYSLGHIYDIGASYLSSGALGVKVLDPSGATTDAVGYAGAPAGYEQGTGLAAPANTSTEYGYVRKESAGQPVDTNDNAADFTLVSADPTGLAGAMLGSPGTQSSTSPTEDNGVLRSTLFDPSVSASSAPNRVYTAGSPGTLIVRRTITNQGAATITTLRIRMTSISTVGVPGTHAILRWVASSTGAGAQGLTLDPPSSSTEGGGLNSTATLTAGHGLPSAGLVPGQSISVAFQFDVDQTGSYWFGYDVDAS